jgi:tetratricopeptide (TPR) repeat protein
VLIFLVILFFGFSDSYKYSLEAKVKYAMGNYEEAMELAKKAFDLDPYNKMSFSILAQSKISIKFLDYIKDGQDYLSQIDFISKKSNLQKSDKIKIRMICEVMIGRFKRLTPTVLNDKLLYENIQNIYNDFVKIYDNIKE